MEIQKNPSYLSSCYEFWALGDIHICTVAEVRLGPQVFMGTYCDHPATLPTILSLVSQTSVFPSTLAPLHFSMEWTVWDHVIHLCRSLQVSSSLGIPGSTRFHMICLLFSWPLWNSYLSSLLHTTHWHSFCSSAKASLFLLQDHYLLLFICYVVHFLRETLSLITMFPKETTPFPGTFQHSILWFFSTHLSLMETTILIYVYLVVVSLGTWSINKTQRAGGIV